MYARAKMWEFFFSLKRWDKRIITHPHEEKSRGVPPSTTSCLYTQISWLVGDCFGISSHKHSLPFTLPRTKSGPGLDHSSPAFFYIHKVRRPDCEQMLCARHCCHLV